jgi:hypothetical protein
MLGEEKGKNQSDGSERTEEKQQDIANRRGTKGAKGKRGRRGWCDSATVGQCAGVGPCRPRDRRVTSRGGAEFAEREGGATETLAPRARGAVWIAITPEVSASLRRSGTTVWQPSGVALMSIRSTD